MRTFTTIASFLALVALSLPVIAQDAPPEKHSIGQFLAPAYSEFVDQAANFPVKKNRLARSITPHCSRPGPIADCGPKIESLV